MIKLNEKDLFDGVFFLSSPKKQPFDEKEYFKLRQKEGRIYTDEEAAKLPLIEHSDNLKNEWKVREKTLNKLIKYFKPKKENNILEIGSGNGWLSNALAAQTANYFFALDLNQYELKQGARVFKENSRLKFIYGDIFEDIFPSKIFNYIIFPSSVQYFENLKVLIERTFYFLKPEGEIHIIDSNLYSDEEVNEAKKRSEDYFNKLGFPGMIEVYHHHKLTDLAHYNYRIKNQFALSLTRIKRDIVFPWIVIKR